MKYSFNLAVCVYTLLISTLSLTVLTAQCPTDCDIQCIGHINLSLDETCMAEITPQMGGIGIAADDPCYTVEVFDAHNRQVPDNIVDLEYLNEELTYKITEAECGNLCWGTITIEYKLAPQIECPPDLTVFCNAVDFLDIPPANGGCANYVVQLYSQEKVHLECDPIYQGYVHRTYRAEDDYGNVDTCSHRVYLKRLPLDDIIFPPPATISCSDTSMRYNEDGVPLPWYYQPLTGSGTGMGIPILCDVNFPTGLLCPGTGSGSGLPLIPQGGGVIIIETGDPDHPIDVEHIPSSSTSILCNAAVIYNDVEFPVINGCKRKILRTFEIYEWWCNAEINRTGTQIIEIVDDIPPSIACPPDQTVSTTSDCSASIYLPAAHPTDQCGTEISVRINYPLGVLHTDGGYADLEPGPNLITYTAKDGCHNTAECHTIFTVKDLNQPVAICERDKVISLTTSNTTSAPAEVFDNGSFDDCGIVKMQVRRMDNPCVPGLSNGTEVKLTKTYQSSAPSTSGGTGSQELPIEHFHGVTYGSLETTQLVSTGTEFPAHLDIYDIDISEDEMVFNSIVDVNNPPYDGYVRVIEPGTYYRYYFDFDKPHGIHSCHPGNDAVKVHIVSDHRIMVEIGEGYDTGSHGFSVELSRFSHYVDFCCVDAQQEEVMVVFRVTDHGGNFSECMVGVEIQDKTIPTLTCPVDVTIDCTENYDIHNLGLTFGNPDVSSNCAVTQIPHVDLDDSINQCGAGVMIRTFSLRDGNDNIIRQCKQVVTVTNNSPFVPSDIEWPQDFEVDDNCDVQGLHPDFLPHLYAYPRFTVDDDECALLGYDYKDEVFRSDPLSGSCAVIQRTWKVVDWCNSVNGNVVTYTAPAPQLIKINNTVPPVLDQASDTTIETQNADCESGEILLIRNATDDCTTELTYSYTMRHANGTTVATGNTNAIQGKFPTGSYIIEWVVYDDCGNSDTDLQALNIISTKAPTPICHNGLSASLVSMDLDGDGTIDAEMVELWASDFNTGSYPSCNNEITFSFSSDINDTNVTFDCNDIGRQTIQMWVTDLVTGNQDFCLAFVDIQDAGLCPDALSVVVEGQVVTEQQVELVGVDVALRGTAINDTTDVGGTYAFANMPMGGNYVVRPEMDYDYLNGVSTIDLIMIQRHILGIESLSSPYKLIAADVNNSGNINGVDLVELRKLILGIYMDLPDNDSWRFVSSDYTFLDALDPWAEPFEEEYVINNLSADMVIDFIGVKIGDVDDSAVAMTQDETSARTSGLLIGTEHAAIAEGESGTVYMYGNGENIIGWQGTLEFDQDKFEILTVESVVPGENPDANVNLQQDLGWMTISHHNELSDHLKSEQVMYKIQILAKEEIKEGEELFEMTSKVTKAEAYNDRMEIIPFGMLEDVNEVAEIISVNPNPWMSDARLKFNISSDGEARIEFFDVNGRLLYTMQDQYVAGIHEVLIERDDIGATGFVYVRLTSGDSNSEYRMIVY